VSLEEELGGGHGGHSQRQLSSRGSTVRSCAPTVILLVLFTPGMQMCGHTVNLESTHSQR